MSFIYDKFGYSIFPFPYFLHLNLFTLNPFGHGPHLYWSLTTSQDTFLKQGLGEQGNTLSVTSSISNWLGWKMSCSSSMASVLVSVFNVVGFVGLVLIFKLLLSVSGLQWTSFGLQGLFELWKQDMPSPQVPGGQSPHLKYQLSGVHDTPGWQGLGLHRPV